MSNKRAASANSMHKPGVWRGVILSDVGILTLLGLAQLSLHMLTNGRYGFHRDELAILDDARFPAWGYVAYPPFTPFVAGLAHALFGPSLIGLRLFAALAQSIAVVLAGLMTRSLGGSRWAQAVTAVAVGIGPIPLIQGAMFQYTSFDYLWWVLIAFLVIRLLKSEDARWWFAIGTAVGLGMMTKYTMILLVAGIVGAVVFTPARRYLTSPWLWAGAVVSLLIFLPNLIWQVGHGFISLEFFNSIHARDVRIGRSDSFVMDQLVVTASLVSVPLWLAGLYWYFFRPEGERYRALGWMYIIPLMLLLVMKGRGYYLAPAYPMLIAAGVILLETWRSSLSTRKARGVQWATVAAIAVGGIVSGALALPIAPVNSAVWKLAAAVHDNFTEQIGWPDLVGTVAAIYAAQPAAERPHVGILTGNYGEAGAIDILGPTYDLPKAISGVNTYWLRGYGDPPPQTVIVLGYARHQVDLLFTTCSLVGHVTNRAGVENEESRDHPDIFVCRGPRKPWPELWKGLRHFGSRVGDRIFTTSRQGSRCQRRFSCLSV
jgi:4-amino-4-deoxy-L-arabinose transferase-like glycosyltransferase